MIFHLHNFKVTALVEDKSFANEYSFIFLLIVMLLSKVSYFMFKFFINLCQTTWNDRTYFHKTTTEIILIIIQSWKRLRPDASHLIEHDTLD